MSDVAFHSLPAEERGDALRVSASRSGRRAHLLEEDIWVVWTLGALLNGSFAGHLTLTRIDQPYRVACGIQYPFEVTIGPGP